MDTAQRKTNLNGANECSEIFIRSNIMKRYILTSKKRFKNITKSFTMELGNFNVSMNE